MNILNKMAVTKNLCAINEAIPLYNLRNSNPLIIFKFLYNPLYNTIFLIEKPIAKLMPVEITTPNTH